MLKVNNLLNSTGTTLPENLLPVTASVWVNFNGTGVVSMRSQYNVSGITDNGIGDYTVNFATPLANANYSCAGICGNFNNLIGIDNEAQAPSVNRVRVSTVDASSIDSSKSRQDSVNVNLVIFGGQS